MHRPLLLVALLSALVFASSAVAAPVFVITGGGWGHSVGMSQWGAYGMVATGRASTHEQILSHYYPGTAIETRADVAVRVLLASGSSTVTIGSSAPFKASDGDVAAGSYPVTLTNDGRIRVSGVGDFASPLRFSPGSSFLQLGGRPYRGDLEVRAYGSALHVRNVVSRELYLRGVVPGEVPTSWYPAVLRAQAVAARSWLMRSLRPTAWFDVYADTRSQVYGGVDEEEASTDQAVADTAGQVLTYGGLVAQAFYHSSSGGRTASSIDVWGGAVPYLVSRQDFDLIPANPHRSWQLSLTAGGLGSRLGTRAPSDAALTRDGSGLAQDLTVTGAGWAATIQGSETLRARLAVKSARFRIGVLSLRASASRVVYGRSVQLAGLARSGGTSGWHAAYVHRKRYGGSWTAVGSALADGAWSSTVRPAITTDYRVASANATGSPARVYVVTRVGFHALRSPYRELKGFVRPSRPGVTVTLQRRRSDGRWGAVATTMTGLRGNFAFPLTRRGTYRALADAGAGYLRGSARIAIVSG